MATAIAAMTSKPVLMRTEHCHRRQQRAPTHSQAALSQIVYRIHHTRVSRLQTMKGMRQHHTQKFRKNSHKRFFFFSFIAQHIDHKCRTATQKTTATQNGDGGKNQRYQAKAGSM